MGPVTLGYYLKNLMMYSDGRFAKHPHFRYIAFNMEMHCRALQAGRVYICQHPEDARLSVDELRDMVSTSFPVVFVTTLVLSGEHVLTG